MVVATDERLLAVELIALQAFRLRRGSITAQLC
jgi:hypothetical protein